MPDRGGTTAAEAAIVEGAEALGGDRLFQVIETEIYRGQEGAKGEFRHYEIQ